MTEELDFSVYFNKPTEDKKEEKKPKNKAKSKKMQIAKCCGTCFYFWYRRSKPRCGWCKINNLKASMHKESKISELDLVWDRTHMLNVCNLYKVRGPVTFTAIKSWTGVDLDG